MLTDRLPPNHIVRKFSRMCRLRPFSRKVLDSLRVNKDDGNQWIVVHNLTDKAIDKLDNDKNTLGVSFRFQWEGTTGLIIIFPSNCHNAILGGFWCAVNGHFHEMGAPRYDKLWLGATTHRSTDGTRFMQADQILCPNQRLPRKGHDWPTLVVMIGVTESKTKFEEDAKWWFTTSTGGVRIVVIILVRRDKVIFEKWDHFSDVPAHSTRQYMGNGERYYCAQEVIVTSSGVWGLR